MVKPSALWVSENSSSYVRERTLDLLEPYEDGETMSIAFACNWNLHSGHVAEAYTSSKFSAEWVNGTLHIGEHSSNAVAVYAVDVERLEYVFLRKYPLIYPVAGGSS